jgi:hypothetical protein
VPHFQTTEVCFMALCRNRHPQAESPSTGQMFTGSTGDTYASTAARTTGQIEACRRVGRSWPLCFRTPSSLRNRRTILGLGRALSACLRRAVVYRNSLMICLSVGPTITTSQIVSKTTAVCCTLRNNGRGTSYETGRAFNVFLQVNHL